MANMTMVHRPILTFEVLLKIFEYLPVEELKKMRTVCADWERPASFSLGKCTHINLKSICDDYYRGLSVSEIRQLPRIKYQLLRNIKIKNTQPNMDLENPYFNFLAMYKHSIQEILFCVNWYKGPTMMMKILFENWIFSNLRKICINEKSYWHPGRFPDVDAQNLIPGNLPLLTNIRELEFNTADPKDYMEDNGHPYLPTFQEIINKSPNLEKLKITGNAYPDLGSATNLKSLEVTAFPLAFLGFLFHIEDDTVDENGMARRLEFSMEKLQEMLGQVSDGLEELILNAITKDQHGDPFNTFYLVTNEDGKNDVGNSQLPSLPKLKSLTINSIDGFIYTLVLSEKSFPLLAKLNVTVNGDPESDLKFLLTDPRPTVTEFSLTFNVRIDSCYHQRSALQCLQSMATCLPNVRKLDITWRVSTLSSRRMCSEHPSVNWLKELEKFWLLEDLTIQINDGLSLWKLLGGITGVSFNGLKTLHIVATETQIVQDECSKKMLETVFRIIPKVSFEGFYFTHLMVKILESFQTSLGDGRFQWID